MTASLLLGGLEMIGVTTNPEYRLATGIDFGQILPDNATLSSLLLDGDIITGNRTGNRTWQLNILVSSPTVRTPTDLQLNVDTLLFALNTSGFAVQWTPAGCPASVTTSRGRATLTVAKNLIQQGGLTAGVTVTFETSPFLQSANAQTITVPSSGGPAQIVIDGMDTGSFTNGTLSTTQHWVGAGSMAVTLTRAGGGTIYQYVSPGFAGRAITSVDLSAMSSVSYRVRWAPAATLTLKCFLVLSSTGGSSTVATTLSFPANGTGWQLASFTVADLSLTSGTGVALNAVTGWTVNFTNPSSTFPGAPPSTSTVNVDDLRAYPPGSVGNTTGEGNVLTIPAVLGSARTPVGVNVNRGGTSTFSSMLVHSPPVTQDPDATILAGLTAGSVVIPAANINYNDTFSLIAVFTATATAARTITAVITQKTSGGVTIGTAVTLTVALTGGPLLVSMGEIALLPTGIPLENTNCTLTIAVTSSNMSDTISDVALCSTSGQTVLVTNLPVATTQLYIDPPDPTVGLGAVYASVTDRTVATNVMGLSVISGGPILFEPGNYNRLLLVSAAGAPGVVATYTPSWLDEALV